MQDPVTLQNTAVPAVLRSQPDQELEIATKQLSQTQLIWIRFRRHKPALLGIVVLLIIALAAILAQILTPVNPYDDTTYTQLNQDGLPSLDHWWDALGFDNSGRPMIVAIIYGARISLVVGFVSAFGVSLIGVIVGAIAGYFGGWVDTVMMRVTDVFLTLPFLPILLLVADLFGQGSLFLIIIIFIFFSWPGIARLARSSYLTLREQEFTEAARAVGVGNMRIIFRHILPNALRPIIVATTLNIAGFIVVEAAIDFLGAGLPITEVSWGLSLNDARASTAVGYWWESLTGAAIVLTVLAVNFIGDGLGDALDVRSKG